MRFIYLLLRSWIPGRQQRLDTVIIHVFPMALEDDGNPNEIRFSEMLSLFEAMGRSPENVMGVIKKMMLLMQHFGM